MDRAKKAQEISALSERFKRAQAAFLVDFKGMNVEQVTQLRKKLHPIESEMKVVRNTLAKLALKDHPEVDAAISDEFVGTNAVIFAFKDAGASAKELSEFGKEVEHLEIKAGVMDGQKLDKARINYLATLPSIEVLRGQLLGLFAAPASKFVRTLAAPSTNFVQVLRARKDSQN